MSEPKTFNEVVFDHCEAELKKEKALGNDRILDPLQRRVFKQEIDCYFVAGSKLSNEALGVVCENCNFMIAYHDGIYCPLQSTKFVMSDRIRILVDMERPKIENKQGTVSIGIETPYYETRWESKPVWIGIEQQRLIRLAYDSFIMRVEEILYPKAGES